MSNRYITDEQFTQLANTVGNLPTHVGADVWGTIREIANQQIDEPNKKPEQESSASPTLITPPPISQ